MGKRTTSQNSGYWLVIDQCLKFYKGNEGALVMDVLRAIKVALTKDFVHRIMKMLFLPKSKQSSTELTTEEMSDFMMAIKAHFAVNHDHDVQLPSEPPLEN